MLRAQLEAFEEQLQTFNEPVRLAQDLFSELQEYRRIVGEAKSSFSKDDFGVAVRVEADTKRVTADIEAVELWRRLCVFVTPENFKLASVDVLHLNFVVLRRLMEAINYADMDPSAELRWVIEKLKDINTPIESLHQCVHNVDAKGNLVPLVPKTVDVIQKHMETLYETWIFHLSTGASDVGMTPESDAHHTRLLFRFVKLIRRSTNYLEGVIGSLVRHRGAIWRAGLYSTSDQSIYSLGYHDKEHDASSSEVRRVTCVLDWLDRFLEVELRFAKTLYHIITCDCYCSQCSAHATEEGTDSPACTCTTKNLREKSAQMLKIDTPESYVQMIFNGELLQSLHSTWRLVAPGFNISEICGLRLLSTPTMPSNTVLPTNKDTEPAALLLLLFKLRQVLQERLASITVALAGEESAVMVAYLRAIEQNMEVLYSRGIEQICEEVGELILDWENPQVPSLVRQAVGLIDGLARESRAESEQLRETVDRICNTIVNSARVQAETSGGYHLLCNLYDYLATSLRDLHPALVEVLTLLSKESALRLAVKEACVFLSTYDLLKYVRVNKLNAEVDLVEAVHQEAASLIAGSLLLFCRSMDRLYLPELSKLSYEPTRALVQQNVNRILAQAFLILFDTLPPPQRTVLPYNHDSFSNLTKTT